MAGDADLRLSAKRLARLAHAAVALPQVHAIGFQSLRQRNAVVDDEGDVVLRADRLQRRRQSRSLVLVYVLYPKLERRDRPRIERPFQPLREIAVDIERGD